jgi:hypothetical protein
MEESGPLNISKKQPNIARTLDGICAFSPEDTISFRFEDSYQYVSSRNIIAISKKIDYAWFNSDNKKKENDTRQDLREILQNQNSIATVYQRNFKNFLLMHVPSGDVYTLCQNKKYDPSNTDSSESDFNHPIIVKPSSYDKPEKTDVQVKF